MDATIEGFVKALGGGVGALFSTTVLYPLEVTKTKAGHTQSGTPSLSEVCGGAGLCRRSKYG